MNRLSTAIKISLYIALTCIVVFVAVFMYLNDWGYSYSNQLSDMIMQNGDIQSGNVCIIGIDEHSLDELGPYQTWTRDNVANAIKMLNKDPKLAPAVIGVDVLYIGTTGTDADDNLVDAVAMGNNVVLGSYLNYDSVLVEEDGAYAIENAITLYEEPFDELLSVSDEGFVNGFYDKDGVVRHGVVSVPLGNGDYAQSFSYAVANKYLKAIGSNDELNVPKNEDGYWYIDYTDAAGGYDNSFSLSDVIDGEIPPEYFTDCIVLIGPYAEGMMDSYTVAIDRASDMYGVEIHANMIEAMLAGRYKKEVARTLMSIIIGLAVAGSMVLVYRNKLIYSIAYTGIFVIVYPIVALFIYDRGYLLNIFYIPVFVLGIMIINIVVHYLRAIAEKRRVEGTFKRYVAPEIVNTIMEQGMDTINLGGEAVDCAILFVDIRGFTTMSELLEPEQVVSILNKYLELTSSSIFKYEGTLDKYIGDATMAIFGAPIKLDDYVYKAVCAAWDMVEQSHKLSEELMAQYGRTVSFGIGVHCGKAVVGNIGTKRRMDYTAIGDTVNTSARLEANAPKDTVYISKNVVSCLEGRISCESVGNIPLKGKSEELEVFKLTGIK